MRKLVALLGSVSALTVGNTALAQTAGMTNEASESATTTVGNGILVTATKRQETVQDVPISMNVFDGEELANQGIDDFSDLSTVVPGFVYQDSPIVPYVTLRGFGTATTNPGYDQAVAVYTDGIYSGRSRQFQSGFFDQERVEVLLGPQGALLGKNSSAGAINFISAAPRDQFEASITSTYLFEREGVDVSGYVTGPVSDSLSLRLAIRGLSESDGYVKNAFTGEGDPRSRVFSTRLSADFHPSENFKSLARFEYNDLEVRGTQAGNQPAGPIDSFMPYERNFGGARGFGADGLALESWQFSNTAEIALGDYTLVSVTGLQGYEGGNIGGTGYTTPESFAISQQEEWFQASQELRLVSPTGRPVEWIAGIYADFSDYEVLYSFDYGFSLFGNLIAGTGQSPFEQDAKTFSAYATGTFHLSDTIRLVAGLRYTHSKRTGEVVHQVLTGIPFGFVDGNSAQGSLSEDHLDPSAAIQFDVAPGTMIYASYASGSKSGALQANSRTVTQDTFILQPEEAESFEVGIKSQPTDWMTFNLSLFNTTIKDLHSAQFVGTPPTLISVNAGEGRSRGAEFTLMLEPAPGFSLSAIGTYLDAEYTDYPNAPCTENEPSSPSGCDAAGRPLSATAKWSSTITGAFDQPVSDNLRVFGNMSALYRSRTNIDANRQNLLWGYEDGHVKFNARIGFGDIDDGWELALVARNLFNKKTLNSTFPWGFPFLPQTTVVTRPDPTRSIGLQFKATVQ